MFTGRCATLFGDAVRMCGQLGQIFGEKEYDLTHLVVTMVLRKRPSVICFFNACMQRYFGLRV